MRYAVCVYCEAELELNENSHRDRYQPVSLNEDGLCSSCSDEFPNGLPAGLSFENDHARYMNMLQRYFKATGKWLRDKNRKRLYHIFKI